MTRLYACVGPGCAAGRYQEVFNKVLLPRIWRDRRTNYSTRLLKMFGSDIAALSNFFKDRQWTELRATGLEPSAQVLILANAGVRLRAQGRIEDSLDAFGAARNVARFAADDRHIDEDASYAAAQSCELLVIRGYLAEAVDAGEEAVEKARKGREPYFLMHSQSSLAEVQFMLREFEKAGKLFNEARRIDRMNHPKPPFDYSQSLFRYTYFQIEAGRVPPVLPPDSRLEKWGTNGRDTSLLSRAIRLQCLGALHRALIEAGDPSGVAADAERYLDQAVAHYETAGYMDYLVRGLTERALFRAVRHGPGDWTAAMEDLGQAEREAEREEARVLLADVRLCRVRLHIEAWSDLTPGQRRNASVQVRSDLTSIEKVITDCHYVRRLETLNNLKSRWSAIHAAR
jgi:tetratricopeptide (TPR) repeat protein